MDTKIESISEEESDEITAITDGIISNLVLSTDEELEKSSSEEDTEYIIYPVETSFIITCITIAIIVGTLIGVLIASILIDNYKRGITKVDESGVISETSMYD